MKFISNGCKWAVLIKTISIVAVLFLSSCAAAQIQVPNTWQSALYSDHALVGKIWDSQRDQFIETDELLTGLNKASYLLLGEKHDNPDHHNLQQTILEYFIVEQRISHASFEMMNSEQQPLLDNLYAQQLTDLNEINEYLDWDNDGWNWEYYGAILQLAVQAKLEISAANISDESMMQAYAESTPAFMIDILNEQTMSALVIDIDESHCGLLPESQYPAMVRVQQARDYAMAASLGAVTSSGLQLLIAGNYHIRHDLGVPNYLLHRYTDLSKDQIASLAFIEVDPSTADPSDYLQQFGQIKAYDYIWFTPAISDEDYCASLQQ